MAERLYVYRPRDAQPEDDRTLMLWYRHGEAPQEVEGDGITWDLRQERAREQAGIVPCIREWIRAVSLPRWWPYARHHDKDGTCIFENETEAKDAAKRARDAGEMVSWDR